ncbi:MAG: ParB/RepB/Spo0J family partition protein [Cyanobacteria bacterium J06650_10]
MARRSKKVDFLENLSAVTEQMQDKDREANRRREQERGTLSSLPLERIKNRESNTRTLNMEHVQSLKESISTLGLIEPLAVDQEKVLLAGGHRLAAIASLLETEPDTFERHFPNSAIPVRVMPFIAEHEPDRALQVEVAENEYRRDYTSAEVRSIADRLIEAGYKDVKGRPKKGQKVLMPALSTVVGKNRRTIQRYLHGESKKSRTDVHLFLKKAKKALESWQAQPEQNTSASKELHEQLPEILNLLNAVIEEDIAEK